MESGKNLDVAIVTRQTPLTLLTEEQIDVYVKQIEAEKAEEEEKAKQGRGQQPASS